MKIAHAVADYAAGDLAFTEVSAALAAHLPDGWTFMLTPVESFNTVATGFVLAQLALQREHLRPRDTILFANCAPRQDASAPRRDNQGEGLLYGVLHNGVPILSVNSGYSLSFVRGDLRQLWSTQVPDSGSQFRSRDLFPPYVGKVARGELDFLGQELDPATVIPEAPRGVIGYIDSFGNLKTTYRDGDFPLLGPGQRVVISINGVKRTATVATGSFSVREGDIAFAPGSSGHDWRFWEVFQRGGSAALTFGSPRAGAPVELKPD